MRRLNPLTEQLSLAVTCSNGLAATENSRIGMMETEICLIATEASNGPPHNSVDNSFAAGADLSGGNDMMFRVSLHHPQGEIAATNGGRVKPSDNVVGAGMTHRHSGDRLS